MTHPLLAKLDANSKNVKPPMEFDDDLIPEIEPDGVQDDGLDVWLDRVGIIDAYNRWANKGIVVDKGKEESIKVRCPNPNHEDNHPSAWLNTRKGSGGIGMCRACGDMGFDKFQIFAWNKGLTPAGQKIESEFPEVRRAMASELGATIVEVGGKSSVLQDPPLGDSRDASPASPEPDGDELGEGDRPAGATPPLAHHPLLRKMHGEPEPEPAKDEVKEDGGASVHDIKTKLRVPLPPTVDAGLDWESMLTPGTFLGTWMEKLTERTDVPHEYIFFNGMVALGAVCGRNVYFDESRHVYPNLMVLLFGDTSTGKSRSFDPLTYIVNQVDPYEDLDASKPPTGTKMLGIFGSGESLIAGMRKQIVDPATTLPIETVGLNGLAKMEEFSLTMSMARRPGNSFKEYLMSIYDTGSAAHTSLASGDLSVNDAFLQVVSTTQPEAVHEFLNRGDAFSGFLNRWVVVSGVNRRGRPLSIQPPLPDLSGQIRLLRDVKSWADKGHSMRLEGDAFGLWDQFYAGGLRDVQADGSPLLARWDLTLKKFMLILAANEGLNTPSKDIVTQVIEYLFPYMRNVYMQFGEKMIDNDRERVFDDSIQYVMDHFKRHKEWPTVRDMKKSRVGKRHGGMKVVDACDWAAKMGLILKVVTKQTVRYAAVSD